MKQKLQLILVLFLLVTTINLNAQNDNETAETIVVESTETRNEGDSTITTSSIVKTTKEENRYLKHNHWSLAVRGGFTFLDGDGLFIDDQIQYTVGGEVDYAFSPRWSMNIQYNYSKFAGQVESTAISHKMKYNFNGSSHELTVNASVNLLNLFMWDRKQTWNLYAYVGAGFGSFKTNVTDSERPKNNVERTYAMTIPVGAMVEYSPHENIGIFLRGEYSMYQSDKLDAAELGVDKDKLGSLTLGLRYKITAKGRKHMRNISWEDFCDRKSTSHDEKLLQEIKGDLGKANDSINDRMNDLEDQMDDLMAKFNQLTPNVAGTAVVPVVATNNGGISKDQIYAMIDERILENIPSIFFDHNSSEINAIAKNVITDIANRMCSNPEYNIKITATADVTGDKDYNQKLSERRANAVKNVLVNEYGIPAERITIEAVGQVEGCKANKYRPGRRCDFSFSK